MGNTLKTSKRVYSVFKRFFDILGSFLGLIINIPIFIIVPILIKCTSKGPIFFRQERIGKDKKIFVLYKFRSMKFDAPEIAPSDMTPELQKKLQYKFGSFIRKTSIDEIPQLWNILKGDMAFIGPRPGAAHNEEKLVELREKYIPNAFDVRPGLGGLAQFKMGRDHNPETKAYYDHEYVKNMNIFLDIKLFVITFFGVFNFLKGK